MRALLERGWRFINARLEPARVRFVCAAILICAVVLLAISFATAEGGLTPFGPPLGADFAGFYNAGAILNQPLPSDRERLYDLAFQDAHYHQLLPRLADEKKLPFVHPPFVAVFFSYFTRLRYEWAFACWLAISAGMYLVGFILLRRTVLRESPIDWPTALLLALSFEPFVFECWLGGQLSAFGFFCVATALALEHRSRFVAAGAAYGLLVYKPTLLVLVLPALILGRRWRVLLGFVASVSVLAGVSYVTAGARNCTEYAQVLFGFAQTAAGDNPASSIGTMELPLWKYVDLNSFFQLLLGGQAPFHWLLFAAAALPLLVLLFRAWRRSDPDDRNQQRLVWAGLLTATLVVNVYVGVYDTIFAVPAILVGVDIAIRRYGSLPQGFRGLLLSLYLVPWITQPLAKATGVQVFTLVLVVTVIFLTTFIKSRAFCAFERHEAGL